MRALTIFLVCSLAAAARYVARDSSAVRYLDSLGLTRDSPGTFVGELHLSQFEGYRVERVVSAMSDNPFAGYSDSSAVISALRLCANRSSGEVREIGRSVNGNAIWALRLGPMKEERPVVALMAGIHGDEVVGAELLLRFASHLLDNDAAHLIHSVNVWLVPRINPDGYLAKTRENANGVDLNRNFPDEFDGAAQSPLQPETAAMMSFLRSIRPQMVAVLHGGAEVCNYPLDNNAAHRESVYSAALDDALLKSICHDWAARNPDMAENPLYKSSGGTVNGAQWYLVSGGLQDWAYFNLGAMSITPEVSMDKWPRAVTVASRFFPNNIGGMLSFVRNSMQGIHGRVTDSRTGRGVIAEIRTSGIAVQTNAEGYFWRPMPLGRHTIVVAAQGFIAARFDMDVLPRKSYLHNIVLTNDMN